MIEDNKQLNSELLYIENPHVFRTYSGLYFDFANPQPEMISFEDICIGLARRPRFRGHCYRNYFVMQHSLIVSYLLPQNMPEIVLEGLLHDAEEYIKDDYPKPEKTLPSMKEIVIEGNKIRNMIYNKYIPYFQINNKKEQDEVHPLVKKADGTAFLIERDWYKHKDQSITTNYEIPMYNGNLDIVTTFNQISDVLNFNRTEDALISIFKQRCLLNGIDI